MQTVEQFLDLGETALANKFLTRDELTDPGADVSADGWLLPYLRPCAAHWKPCRRSAMFQDYLYVSSASDTLKDHLYDLSDVLVQRYRLGAEDLVIDIGCNDGTLLSGFRAPRSENAGRGSGREPGGLGG